MNYSDIVNQVSKELNLPFNIIDKTYKAYWLFIKKTIQQLPLKEDITEKEFNNIQTNFNIPSLGKLSCTFDRMQNIKDRHITLKKKNHAEYNRN